MIPQSSLCSGADGHGVTEREGGEREEEVEEATTVEEEIRSGLEGSKATENTGYRKEEKV